MSEFLSPAKRILVNHKIKFGVFFIVLILWLFCLPKNLFEDPTSTVVDSSEGSLIGARIADDGQWRFPQIDSVPERFKQSILLFEDEYFYQHPGFNPISFNIIALTLRTSYFCSAIFLEAKPIGRINSGLVIKKDI